MMIDPSTAIATQRRELLAEAERERLVALLPKNPSGVRHDLAAVCVRLANWLDESDRYLQPGDSGPEDWASTSANV
jgi:hypothetical protein